MSNPVNGRSVKPNAAAVRAARVSKGWVIADLVERSGLSEKTVRSVENGRSVSIATMGLIAKALDIECKSLIALGTTASKEGVKRVTYAVVLAVPFQDMDESEFLSALVQRMKLLFGKDGDLEVMRVKEGSTVVTIEIDEDVASLLEMAFANGQLADLQITEVRPESLRDRPTGPPVSGTLSDKLIADIRTRFGEKAWGIFADRMNAGMSIEELAARHGTTADAAVGIISRIERALREMLHAGTAEHEIPRDDAGQTGD